MMNKKNYLQKVADQYEDYPYPERNPNDEINRLYAPNMDALDQVNYYCFQGGKHIDGDFKVLVAGGGTGDTAIFLAEQLRDCGAEVVYLDLSTASMKVAKQRATVRGLDNIKWLQGSLLDLPTMGLGPFDYINCCGVLHHLTSPDEGLSALNSILKDDGAMGVMVYAKYGRTALYMIQDLMRRINNNETNMQTKIENCGKILNVLPETHWFMHSKRLSPDWEYKKPIEMYDLFLHSQDRAYSIPELYEYVKRGGLKILHMCVHGYDKRGNDVYDPCSYLDDAGLIENIKTLPKNEQQAIAELLHGKIGTHTFYVARNTRPLPTATDLDNIPALSLCINQEEYLLLHSLVKGSHDTVKLKRGEQGHTVHFKKASTCEGIFKYLDGVNSLGTIFKKIMNSPKYKKVKPTIPKLQKDFSEILSALSKYDWMFLRFESIKRPVTLQEMESRIKKL